MRATALDWGLVNRVVPVAELDAAVKRFTDRIVARSAAVIALGKRAFYAQVDRPLGRRTRTRPRRWPATWSTRTRPKAWTRFSKSAPPSGGPAGVGTRRRFDCQARRHRDNPRLTTAAVLPRGARSNNSLMANDTILETRGLTKEFKGFVAVNGVDLAVARGTIHALIGPNGAGKTTCFNLLTHFLTPTRGQIFFNGNDITGSRPAAIARMGLVRSFQISAVFPHLTVLENVRIALQRKRGHSLDFWRSERVLHEHDARARELIDAVGLRRVRAGDRGRARLRPQARARDRDDAGARAGDDAARRADGRA